METLSDVGRGVGLLSRRWFGIEYPAITAAIHEGFIRNILSATFQPIGNRSASNISGGHILAMLGGQVVGDSIQFIPHFSRESEVEFSGGLFRHILANPLTNVRHWCIIQSVDMNTAYHKTAVKVNTNEKDTRMKTRKPLRKGQLITIHDWLNRIETATVLRRERGLMVVEVQNARGPFSNSHRILPAQSRRISLAA